MVSGNISVGGCHFALNVKKFNDLLAGEKQQFL